MARNKPAASEYSLSRRPYLIDLGYILMAECIILWLLAVFTLDARGLGGVLKGFASLWWLWLVLTAGLGILAIAGTKVVLDGERLAMDTLGRAWKVLLWRDVEKVRILCVGGTLAVLAAASDGGFRLWRRRGLKDAPALSAQIKSRGGQACHGELSPPYRSRRGGLWSLDAQGISHVASGRKMAAAWSDFVGVRFLFLADEDLPFRVSLFPKSGGKTVVINSNVAFFPFLAADILRQAKAAGLRIVCADMGERRRNKPSKQDRPGRQHAIARAWEEQGRQ